MSRKSCSSNSEHSQSADSTSASGVALPYFSSSRLSSEPALTPIRIGVPWSLAAAAISLPRKKNPSHVAHVETPRPISAEDLREQVPGYPEAGPTFQGTVKSAVAFGALLAEGIGDTIRVSLSAPPVEEVKVGISILESLGMRQRRLEIVSCPSCGRAQVDVYKLAEEVTAGLEGMEVPLRVAVMGCVVNGPGEAREADLGVASGNGKGQIFVRGKVIATVPESQIVETLIEEAMRLAEQGAVSGEGAEGQPVVTTY